MTTRPEVAPTPPMGWNSWDCYGTTVTEAEVLANAEFMAERMLHVGWDTVVVDIQWYEPTARAGGYNDSPPVELDAHGRQVPAVNRFPSAAGGAGFGPLADAVHALGLKLGVHVMRGIPRRAVELDLPVLGTSSTARDVADTSSVCSWNPDNYGLDHDHPDAQAYYDSQVAQLVGWGVDLIKADDMLAPYHDAEIAAYARAVERAVASPARGGRPVVLSLSPGTHLSTAHLPHLRENATMWRVSDDLWDRWEDVHAQFTRMARWAPHQRPGAWADADMLPLGRIGIRAERGEDRPSRLTGDEQRTLLTLWCVSRSPLMMGGDLPTTDPGTVAMLTHRDLIELLQHSTDGQEVLREGDLVVWTARGTAGGADGARYVAVFWTGDAPTTVHLPASSVGLPTRPGARGTELWTGADITTTPSGAPTTSQAELVLDVPAHGVRLVRVDHPGATSQP
jgi:alpha-galactosidase